MAVQFNPTNNEPFIRLPSIPKLPNKNLIITPHRESDGAANIAAMNHPSVYKNLYGPPFPYVESDWTNWFSLVSKEEKAALEDYLAVEDARVKGEKGKWVGSGQFGTVIRDEESGELVGSIRIRRSQLLTVLDPLERERQLKVNDELEAGSPDIEWDMGFVLSPAVQGKGIMPIALTTLMEKFYIPYMNAHIITGSYFDFNKPSKRVFEKCGFVFEEMVPDLIELKESKFGVKDKKCGLGLMRWVRM